MQIIKKFKWLLFGLLFINFVGAFAYDNLVIHPKLTQASINIYNNNSDNDISSEESQAIVFGSIVEDTDPRYLHHFYNPETGKGLKGAFSSAKEWAYHQPSATGDYSVDAILENYRNGELARAYEGVGHILHLIQDMSVPAHTRDDAHGEGDPLEEWAKEYGQVDISQVEFIEVDDLDQVFDDLASYSHDNFFSKDTIINIEDRIVREIIKKINNEDRTYLICNDSAGNEFVCLRKIETPTLVYYKIDEFIVHQDYWKMLYPKAVGYSAGVIDYFQKEFAKIDQEKKQEKLSLWNKIKNFFSDTRYNWGDRVFYYHLAFNSIFNHISGEENQPDPWQQFVDNFPQADVLGDKDNSPNEDNNNNQNPPAEEKEVVKISYVIDGDTFVLENGDKVRYIGIDTPELGRPGPDDDECLAWVARLRNMQLLGKGEITLIKDPSADKDKYGRLLRYVYVNDIFINETMVREGLAETFFCQPGWKNCPVTTDEQRKNIILNASQQAQNNNQGIFSSVCAPKDKKKSSDNNNSPDDGNDDQNNNQEQGKKEDGRKGEDNYFFPDDKASYGGINTTISQKPKLISNSSQADFSFASTRSDASYQCNFNNSGWQECQATSSWSGLGDEFHNIKVKSYFDDEFDTTPAKYNWLVDTQAPTSSVDSLAEEQEAIGFTVSWQGGDEGLNASGLAGFDVQYQISEEGWQDWLVATNTTSYNFNIEVDGGQQICFRSRAADYAGNYESWPESADSCTYLKSSETPELNYFYLQSLTSTSTDYTASTTVSLDYNITNQEFVDAYFFSSSSSTPLNNDSGWATSTPAYFTFSAGDGEKQVYFWVKHHSLKITLMGSATIILDTQAPSAPIITNIIPQNEIYWVATTSAWLAGDKDEGANQILINGNNNSAQATSTEWGLMHEFGFTRDGLEQMEFAQADFWTCAIMIPPMANFQQETLNFQAQDEAGNLSEIASFDFQMDTYAPTITYFDAFGGSADGYVYFSAYAMDNYMGGSGIKRYEFEYKEPEGDWQVLLATSWNSEEYNYRAPLPAGDYVVRMTAYDWVENASSPSEEESIISNPRPVLSEVYGGGGNLGSYWQNDFIEIYNPTDNDVSLEGWSVQYAPSDSSSWSSTLLSGTIASHGFYLIEEYQGSGGEVSLPTPDASGSTNLAATNGKVALVSNSDDISGLNDEDVVDFLGYGTANEFEGEAGASAGSNTASIERKASESSTEESMAVGGAEEFDGNGYDSDENSADWLSRNLPEPQNTASSTE